MEKEKEKGNDTYKTPYANIIIIPAVAVAVLFCCFFICIFEDILSY